MDIQIHKHNIVPKHVKITEEEKESLLNKFNVKINQLAIINFKDPAIQHLNVVEGDVIKIIRKSPTIGESVFYRIVK